MKVKDVWVTVCNPGWFGTRWQSKEASYDQTYGPGNWRIRHRLGARLLDRDEAFRLYELCYEMHYLDPRTHYLWLDLFRRASNIWTELESDVQSGTDYLCQLAPAPHYEDVAIRIIAARYGRTFTGNRLVRVRADSTDTVGNALSSVRIPFVFPDAIESYPEVLWWNRHGKTLECFWHSNKLLQVKNEVAV